MFVPSIWKSYLTLHNYQRNRGTILRYIDACSNDELADFETMTDDLATIIRNTKRSRTTTGVPASGTTSGDRS